MKQGHKVKGVLSNDEDEGMKVWHEELAHRSLNEKAKELGIPVFEGLSINSPEMAAELQSMELDLLLSVFWGEIVKPNVLEIPAIGCFNLHTAYLPQNKGSFPIPWAIINDDGFCGLTIHRMDPGVDDGPILEQVKVPIMDDDTGAGLYNKVCDAGFELFKDVLPRIAENNFSLTEQAAGEGSYHPRGYPYGRQIDAMWSPAKQERFKRALTFPPFDGSVDPPAASIDGEEPRVRLLISFDCERPRGEKLDTEEGLAAAERKLRSLDTIRNLLNENSIPRTYFICGSFLVSMVLKYGNDKMKDLFDPDNELVEIADHSYSHQVSKAILTRPDKEPLKAKEVLEEYQRNTEIFQDIFGKDLNGRGFRTPLGHRYGLQGKYRLLDLLKGEGVAYVSSALRDENDSLNPKFVRDQIPRQPYRYENGMLEIPSHGWQDTVFTGKSNTTLFEDPPTSVDEILDHYRDLITKASDIVTKYQRDYFLSLLFHPLSLEEYGPALAILEPLIKMAQDNGATFHLHQEVMEHYNNKLLVS